MIGVELSGGLGNQFFRYAYSRKLIEDRGNKDLLVMNKRHVEHNETGDIECFNIYNNRISLNCRRVVFKYGNLKQKVLFFVYALSERMISFFHLRDNANKSVIALLKKLGVFVMNNPGEIPPQTNESINRILLLGSFENHIYFEGLRDVLLKEFTPVFLPQEYNKNMYELISKTNSVCLGIRRGDYLIEENTSNFYVCTLDH